MKVSVASRIAFFAAAAFGAAASADAGPVVVNGSFESPAYDQDGVYRGGGHGWIPSFMGPVSIIRGNIVDNRNRPYGVTPYGAQYLGLDPRSPQGFISRDSQTIPGFVEGRRYVLTLEAADSDGGLAPQLEVLLSNDGDITYLRKTIDLPVGGPYGKTIDFQPIRIVFRSPVTDAITLSLTNTGTGPDPGSISIDKVRIRTVKAGEPGADDAEEDAARAAMPSATFSR